MLLKLILNTILVNLIQSNCQVGYKIEAGFAPGKSILPTQDDVIKVIRVINMKFYEIHYDQQSKPVAVYTEQNSYEYQTQIPNIGKQLNDQQQKIELDASQQISVRQIKLKIKNMKNQNSEQDDSDEDVQELVKNLQQPIEDDLDQMSVQQSQSVQQDAINTQNINVQEVIAKLEQQFKLLQENQIQTTQPEIINESEALINLKNANNIQKEIKFDMDCNLLQTQRGIYSTIKRIDIQTGIIDVVFNLKLLNREIQLNDVIEAMQDKLQEELTSETIDTIESQFEKIITESNNKGKLTA